MIGTSSPVFGLRPTRRPFWRTEKVPKPLILTDSPDSNVALTRLNTLSSKSAHSLRDRPTSAWMISARCARVTVSIPQHYVQRSRTSKIIAGKSLRIRRLAEISAGGKNSSRVRSRQQWHHVVRDLPGQCEDRADARAGG